MVKLGWSYDQTLAHSRDHLTSTITCKHIPLENQVAYIIHGLVGCQTLTNIEDYHF